MKELIVPFLKGVSRSSPIAHLSFLLDSYPTNTIGMVPWPRYGYKPDVNFTIAYGSDCIFIKYYVTEKTVRAVYSQPNQPVYKDSCVEFFVAFGDEKEYYNFEFNCAGTCLVGFGENREDRKLLPEPVIRMIRHHAQLKVVNNQGEGNIAWELTLMIPLEAFYYHSLESVDGWQCRANFYKCGDDLPDPHFLTWNHIKSADPDFHLPEFFGKIKFGKQQGYLATSKQKQRKHETENYCTAAVI
jgi:hypothetical protein